MQIQSPFIIQHNVKLISFYSQPKCSLNCAILIEKSLPIHRDLIKIENAEIANAATKALGVQVSTYPCSSDDESITMKTAKSDEITNAMRIIKKLTMAKSNIAANKKNFLIRKIHVRIERNIHITNHHRHIRCHYHHFRNRNVIEGQRRKYKEDANNNNEIKVMTNTTNHDEEDANKPTKVVITKHRIRELFSVMGKQLLKDIYDVGCEIFRK